MMHITVAFLALAVPILAQAAPIDRTRMRVAEEAMREQEKLLAPTHSVYYAPAPCPRVIRDVLKKIAEIDGKLCTHIEPLPCSNGLITLNGNRRARWQKAPYETSADRIALELKAILKQKNIPEQLAENFAKLTETSEGQYADLLQICVPKISNNTLDNNADADRAAQETRLTLSEADLSGTDRDIKIFRYSPINPAHEQVYSKEFASLMARILGAQKKLAQ